MIDTAIIERYMRDANPISHLDDLDPDEFARFVAAADARRAATRQAPTQRQSTPPPPTIPPPRRRRSIAWAFTAAFVLILAGIGIAVLALQSNDPPVIDQPVVPIETEQLTWIRVVDDVAVLAPGDHASISKVTSGGPGMVAVGEVSDLGGPGSKPAVWTSLNGYEWSVALLADSLEDETEGWVVEPMEMRSVTATESGLYAVGYGWYGFHADPEGAYGPTGIVWTSPDGTDWTAILDIAVFRDSELLDIIEGGPGLVAIGRSFSRLGSGAEVWTSQDGAVWTRVVVPRSNPAVISGVAVGGPGVVAVGHSGDDAAVWTSPDGNVWTRVPHDETAFGGPGYQEMTSVTSGGPGLVAVGGDRGCAAVWTSPDGSHWTRIPHDEVAFGGFVDPEWGPDGFPNREWGPDYDPPMKDVITTDSGLVAVGVDPGSGGSLLFEYPGSGDSREQAAAWTSRDGSTWFRIPYLESATTMNSVAEGGPGLIAVGTYEGRSTVWLAQP